MAEYITKGDVRGAGSQIEHIAEIYQRAFGYKTDGAFVEVGAFDGSRWSFTSFLADLGWRGIMLEPNPEQYNLCAARHKNNNVRVIQCCVGARFGKTKLYLGGSLSTTKLRTVKTYNTLDWGRAGGLSPDNFIICPVRTLDYILHTQSGWPEEFDLLVIDVEGAELDVLKGFVIDSWRPKLCIVETHEEYPDVRLSSKSIPIGRYFDQHGYKKIYTDTINSIYVRKSA